MKRFGYPVRCGDCGNPIERDFYDEGDCCFHSEAQAEIDTLRKELAWKDSVLRDCKLLIESKITEIDRKDADIMKWVKIAGENQKSANLCVKEIDRLQKYERFWEWSRLADKQAFEQDEALTARPSPLPLSDPQ